MCLAIPGRIITIQNNDEPCLRSAMVSFGGITKRINISMVPEAGEKDYVLVHVGVAITIIDEKAAEETLRYLKELESPDHSKD